MTGRCGTVRLVCQFCHVVILPGGAETSHGTCDRCAQLPEAEQRRVHQSTLQYEHYVRRTDRAAEQDEKDPTMTRLKLLSFALLALLASAACAAPGQPAAVTMPAAVVAAAPASLQVQATAGDNRTLLPGVHVVLTAVPSGQFVAGGVTDLNGNLALQARAGDLALLATKAGYQSQGFALALRPGGTSLYLTLPEAR